MCNQDAVAEVSYQGIHTLFRGWCHLLCADHAEAGRSQYQVQLPENGEERLQGYPFLDGILQFFVSFSLDG